MRSLQHYRVLENLVKQQKSSWRMQTLSENLWSWILLWYGWQPLENSIKAQATSWSVPMAVLISSVLGYGHSVLSHQLKAEPHWVGQRYLFVLSENGFIKDSTQSLYGAEGLQACNAVAVARMLNATLVLPRFLFNSVWRDSRYLFSTHWVCMCAVVEFLRRCLVDHISKSVPPFLSIMRASNSCWVWLGE